MSQIFEVLMLLCFGISWPISVIKALKSKSTAGKSLFFTLIIIVGYIAGILSKICKDEVTYVLYLYIFNLVIVNIDMVILLINKKREGKKKDESKN